MTIKHSSVKKQVAVLHAYDPAMLKSILYLTHTYIYSIFTLKMSRRHTQNYH